MYVGVFWFPFCFQGVNTETAKCVKGLWFLSDRVLCCFFATVLLWVLLHKLCDLDLKKKNSWYVLVLNTPVYCWCHGIRYYCVLLVLHFIIRDLSGLNTWVIFAVAFWDNRNWLNFFILISIVGRAFIAETGQLFVTKLPRH